MSEQSTREILIAARELISDPDRWTQHSTAKDRAGNSIVGAHDTSAVCWCATGALRKVGIVNGYGLPAFWKAWDSLQKLVPDMDVVEFNDTHTHAEVLDLFDRAIAEAS